MVHPGLARLASSEGGRAWLERLPRLVDEIPEQVECARWLKQN